MSVESRAKHIYIYLYVSGNPQPEAIGHTRTCLQPESGGPVVLCTACSLVNWETTHS